MKLPRSISVMLSFSASFFLHFLSLLSLTLWLHHSVSVPFSITSQPHSIALFSLILCYLSRLFFFCFFLSYLSQFSMCVPSCMCVFACVGFCPPLLFFLPDFPSSDFTLFFLSLTRYRFALPPWLTRAHTRTDAHIPFSLSVRLIWISTCLPALARCLPSLGNTAERRGGTPKAQPP